MIVTRADLDLWVEVNKPKWTKMIRRSAQSQTRTRLIDIAINARSGFKYSVDLSNAVSLLLLVRSNQARGCEVGTLLSYMWTHRYSEPRGKSYRRWLRRMVTPSKKGDSQMSGYAACSCRDCFEIVIVDTPDGPAFCHGCEEAGCPDYHKAFRAFLKSASARMPMARNRTPL